VGHKTLAGQAAAHDASKAVIFYVGLLDPSMEYYKEAAKTQIHLQECCIKDEFVRCR
jgi:hypothetical protein